MPPKRKTAPKGKSEAAAAAAAEVDVGAAGDAPADTFTKELPEDGEPAAVENGDDSGAAKKPKRGARVAKAKPEPKPEQPARKGRERKAKAPLNGHDEEEKPESAEETVAQKKTMSRRPVKRESSKSDDEADEEVEAPKKARKGRKVKAAAADEKAGEKSAEPANQTSTSYNEVVFKCDKKNKLGKPHNLTISSWNVDGLRAWLKKEGLKYLEHEMPDIICLQETKCSDSKLPEEIKAVEGYETYWCASKKEGYAGVGLLSKIKPVSVTYGIGEEEHDEEGRCITAEYKNFYLVGVYVPNAGRKLITLPKRLEWNEAFKSYVAELDKKKPVILCGDMNVAHEEIDLANPKTNTKNAGFTKEEREGMTDFLGDQYVDTFRHFYPDKASAYTFWTYIGKARSKNVGWRLDYFITSKRLINNVCDTQIRNEVYGSDHCPIVLFINV